MGHMYTYCGLHDNVHLLWPLPQSTMCLMLYENLIWLTSNTGGQRDSQQDYELPNSASLNGQHARKQHVLQKLPNGMQQLQQQITQIMRKQDVDLMHTLHTIQVHTK